MLSLPSPTRMSAVEARRLTAICLHKRSGRAVSSRAGLVCIREILPEFSRSKQPLCSEPLCSGALWDLRVQASDETARLSDLLANIHPFGIDELGHAKGIDPHRGVGRARRRDHLVKGAERNVEIDGQRRGEPEWADTAAPMPGGRQQLVRRQHLDLAA